MTSCSRDTTIRVWSLASYAGPWIVSSFNGNVKYGESDSSTPLKDQQQKLSGKLQDVAFYSIKPDGFETLFSVVLARRQGLFGFEITVGEDAERS